MNCNHFTSYLVEQLTNRPAPSWLNRAASIGVALPCVVPREWIDPPDSTDYGPEAGGLLDEEDFGDERSAMLGGDQRRRHRSPEDEAERWAGQVDGVSDGSSGSGRGGAEGYPRFEARNHAPRLVAVKSTDSSGRPLPAAERAPMPSRIA